MKSSAIAYAASALGALTTQWLETPRPVCRIVFNQKQLVFHNVVAYSFVRYVSCADPAFSDSLDQFVLVYIDRRLGYFYVAIGLYILRDSFSSSAFLIVLSHASYTKDTYAANTPADVVSTEIIRLITYIIAAIGIEITIKTVITNINVIATKTSSLLVRIVFSTLTCFFLLSEISDRLC